MIVIDICLRLAQNEIFDTFLCIGLQKNLETTSALSYFLSILCWVVIVQVHLEADEDKKAFSYWGVAPKSIWK